MNEDHHNRWMQALQTGMPVLAGRNVACDRCDADYTDSTEEGGLLLGTSGYCPKCAAKMADEVKEVLARNPNCFYKPCPPGKSFADLCRDQRGAFSTVSAGFFDLRTGRDMTPDEAIRKANK